MKKTTVILLSALVLTGIPVFADDGDLFVTGKVGIGTTAPGQKVSVAGMIESTNGGIKFPDGTIQTTAVTTKLSISDTFGCSIANNAANRTRDIDVSAGRRRSDDDAADIVLAAALTKRADQTWAAGTGNGGLQSGQTKVANKWYDVFLIYNPIVPAVDVQFCRMDTAFAFPSGYTNKRRLGSFRTNGSSNIITFTQTGDYFWWSAPVNEGIGGGLTTITVPGGSINGTVRVQAIVYGTGTNGQEPSGPAALSFNGSYVYGEGVCLANTSSQINIGAYGLAATIDVVVTNGWIDNRGKDF